MSTQTTVAIAAGTRAPESPWPAFWIASIAVLLVSIDTTVLYAGFGALRQALCRERDNDEVRLRQMAACKTAKSPRPRVRPSTSRKLEV